MRRPAGSALHLRGIRQAFGGRLLLDAIDLEVRSGTSLALLGANGSGKTTLLRIAAGLRQPDAGSASLGDGTPVRDARHQGRLGYIPQHLGLVRPATVLQNATMGALNGAPWWRTLAGRPAPATRERVRQALATVGLAEHADKVVRDISGGERQRTAIARTLVQQPDVVVADEFVSSLDAKQARLVLRHLDVLKGQGCAIAASMHNVAGALQWADQVAVIRAGRLWGPFQTTSVTEQEVLCILDG